jgi:hypothetical protein
MDDVDRSKGGVRMNDIVEVDISGFNAGMAGLVNRCRIEPRKVVVKETGELMKTLVRVTPPSEPAKTRQRIAAKVTSRFQAAETVEASGSGGKSGSRYGNGETDWYAWSPQFLFGVSPDKDLRRASVDDLSALYYRLTATGKQSYQFTRFKNRRQRILISQKVLTKQSTIKKLIAKLQSHIGRLKAGWLVAYSTGAIPLTGGNMPPAFVTRHMNGAKGRFIDGLGVEDYPTFAIGNSAKGVGDKRVAHFVSGALDIRAKAMVQNARLIFSGKKKLADYAK